LKGGIPVKKSHFIKLDEVNSEIIIDSLPVWSGVSRYPESLKVAPFRLGQNSSGLFYQNSTQKTLDKLFDYSSESYQHGTSPPSIDGMQKDRAMSFLRHIGKLCGGVEGKNILEIGAGSTFLGEYLTESAGARSYVAVDPSISVSPNSLKCRVLREFFDSVKISEKFDIVLSVATLEHVFDPLTFLIKARSLLLNDDGMVVTIVPNIEPEFAIGDFNSFAHEHIQYFYEASLRQVHEASGLHVAQLYSEKHALYLAATRDKTIGAKLDISSSILPGLKSVAKVYETSIDYICSLLENLEGKKVAFYGATNGLNNLLHLLDIRDSKLAIFDSDPLKSGRYLPACDAIVQSGLECRAKEIDIVIVSATQFFSEIRDFLVKSQGFRIENIYSVTPTVLQAKAGN
jgi:2-polyprenyl-3-methyl-5-hydroxy-6-metoxy-1,4-benzoquinol methylase